MLFITKEDYYENGQLLCKEDRLNKFGLIYKEKAETIDNSREKDRYTFEFMEKVIDFEIKCEGVFGQSMAGDNTSLREFFGNCYWRQTWDEEVIRAKEEAEENLKLENERLIRLSLTQYDEPVTIKTKEEHDLFMNSKEAIIKLYDHWQEWEKNKYRKGDSIDLHFTEQQKKYIFLSSAIVGITTYDDDLDVKYGKMIAETLVQIKNRTTFNYIKDEAKYQDFISSCNYIIRWLDWGSSIRGAWFDIWDGKIEPDESLSNIDYPDDHIKITEDFINWFVDFLTIN